MYLEDQRGTATFEDDPEVVTSFTEVFLDLETRAAAPERLQFYVERALREITEADERDGGAA